MQSKPVSRSLAVALTALLFAVLTPHTALANNWAEAARVLGEAARIVNETNQARADGRSPNLDTQRFYDEHRRYQDARYQEDQSYYQERPRYEQYNHHRDRQPRAQLSTDRLIDNCHLRWSMAPDALRECLAQYGTPERRGRTAGYHGAQPQSDSYADRYQDPQRGNKRSNIGNQQHLPTPSCWESGQRTGDHGGGIFGTGASYESETCASGSFRR